MPRQKKKELMAAMTSMSFTTLERFRQRKMVPGEALPVFLHDLKQLLEQAMPGLDSAAKEQLLLHQFVAGLPSAISKQLRATAVYRRARETVDRPGERAAGRRSSNPTNAIVEKLLEQVAALTVQVAALSVLQQRKQKEFIPRAARESGSHPSKLP